MEEYRIQIKFFRIWLLPSNMVENFNKEARELEVDVTYCVLDIKNPHSQVPLKEKMKDFEEFYGEYEIKENYTLESDDLILNGVRI